MPDKRDLSRVFQERLALLVRRSGESLAQFAAAAGLDRSALSQFMSQGSTRLPRAETLCRLAESNGVTLDWLLGLSQSESAVSEIAPTMRIEAATGTANDTLLAAWHREAVGYKIRYVPATIPDLLRHEDLTEFEFDRSLTSDVDRKQIQARQQLAYSRRPETDMEVCMPAQTLRMIAKGEGVWAGVPSEVRRKQLQHMADLVAELYPTFRLFLFDARKVFSAPYTVFGPVRAALYLGDMYLVINSVDHIRVLIRHFDDLIRHADVGPDRAEGNIRALIAE